VIEEEEKETHVDPPHVEEENPLGPPGMPLSHVRKVLLNNVLHTAPAEVVGLIDEYAACFTELLPLPRPEDFVLSRLPRLRRLNWVSSYSTL